MTDFRKGKRDIGRKLHMFLAASVFAVVLSGCGEISGGDGKKTDDSLTETAAAVSQIMEETQEASSLEAEETENTNAGEMDGTDPADAYREILDMFYYKISGGWDSTEDVSYLFYFDYTMPATLADAGYAIMDLDGNGVSELLVSTVEAAKEGMIYDLYAIADGGVVHAATGGERYCYYLCEDNTIYHWGSSGASNSREISYTIDPDTGLLSAKETVVFDESENKSSPWFYGTGECYSRENGADFIRMTNITEEEAKETVEGYKKIIPIELTTFDQYLPQEPVPDEIRLKQAFRTAAGSEPELYFVCDDFDGNRSMEAFGMTGTDDGIDLSDVTIYYADSDGMVSVMDTFPVIYAYGGIYPGMTMNLTMDAGNAKFLKIGGSDGQETWLYGVRNGEAYQPEVSGKHADFRKTEDGQFIAQPHEGGEGYYAIRYTYDAGTGEFVPADETR